MSATDLNFAVFMAVFANRPTVVFAIITPTNIHPFQRFCTATAFFSSSRQSVEKKRKRRDAKICRSMQNHVLWLINRVCLFTFLTSQKFRLACACVRACVSLYACIYRERAFRYHTRKRIIRAEVHGICCLLLSYCSTIMQPLPTTRRFKFGKAARCLPY